MPLSSIDSFEYFPPTEDSSDDDRDLSNGGAAGGLGLDGGAVSGVDRRKRGGARGGPGRGGKVKVLSSSDRIVEVNEDSEDKKQGELRTFSSTDTHGVMSA